MYTEQEMELIDLVGALQISTEEYEILGGILSNMLMAKYSVEGAIAWLYPHNMDSRVILRSQLQCLKIPYEDLPMYINAKSFIMEIIVLWRLKIGR